MGNLYRVTYSVYSLVFHQDIPFERFIEADDPKTAEKAVQRISPIYENVKAEEVAHA